MTEPVVLGVRHGEVHNPDGVIYAGLPGFGLSEYGRRQAAEVAAQLAGSPVAAVYASPLERAIETAAVLAEGVGVEVVTDERLHEWRHWGQWAGMTWDRLRDEAVDAWNAYQRDPGSVTSGESLAELADRVASWLEDVVERHRDGIVVGVAHLEPLRAILLRLGDRPATDLFEVRIGLAEVVRLHPDPDPAPGAVPDLVAGRV